MRKLGWQLLAMTLLVTWTGVAWGQGEGGISFSTCSGFIGGADMLVLRPYVGDPREIRIARQDESATYSLGENDYQLSPRLWLGYVSECGLGARLRWWDFDHRLDGETGEITDEDFELWTVGRLDMYTVDAEVMQQMDVGLWKANVGGGLRVAGTGRRLDLGVTDLVDAEYTEASLSDRYDGVGPTIFAELRRPLGGSGFALVANARGSVLFGSRKLEAASSQDVELPFISASNLREEHDSVVSIGELEMGAEWARELQNGSRAFVNLLWEGQIWSGTGGLTNVVNNDIGLMGFSVGVGFTR
jgi:hypothetical protein